MRLLLSSLSLSSTSSSLCLSSTSRACLKPIAIARNLSTSSKAFNNNENQNQNQQTSQSQPSDSNHSSSSSSSSSSSTTTRINNNNPRSNNTTSSNDSKQQSQLYSIKPIEFNPSDLSTFPSLISRSSNLYDLGQTFHSKPIPGLPYPSSFTLINEEDSRLFKSSPPTSESLIASSGGSSSGSSGSIQDGEEYLSSVTSFSVKEINEFHRHAISIKRVVRMSGKGKIARMSALIVVGNGKGLVGFGEAKDANAAKAGRKAFQQAVKNLDFVRRFEGRTIETEIEGKWSATKVVLRPRPAGFGLRVPPSIHAVARSAGLSDLSASIRGSANPTSVVKATLQALWPGSSPLGLGDGLGGKGKRSDKGFGARSREEIMRERGRRLEEVRLV